MKRFDGKTYRFNIIIPERKYVVTCAINVSDSHRIDTQSKEEFNIDLETQH